MADGKRMEDEVDPFEVSSERRADVVENETRNSEQSSCLAGFMLTQRVNDICIR